MPSTSKKQARFMQAVANNPAFAKKAGVAQSVGQDFAAADKKAGKKFADGGEVERKRSPREIAIDREVERAVGPPTPPPPAPPPPPDNSAFFKGKRPANTAQRDELLKKHRGYAKGGSIDGCATRGKTKVRYI